MRIGILGGTGNMGRGLSVRWALRHEVIIGSRGRERAVERAEELMRYARGFYQREMEGSITGALNEEAAKAEIVVVALPHEASIPTLKKMAFSEEQIIISTVVPMERRGRLYYPLTAESGRSMAEAIQEAVTPAKVVAAFHTIPAIYLYNLDSILNLDVLIAGDDEVAIATVSKLVKEIPNLRPLRCGPLTSSRWIEPITPLILNVAILNGLYEPSIRIVPWLPE